MLDRIEKEKIYFNPGDVVKIKHQLDTTPNMLVKEKVTKMIQGDSSYLMGFKCFWFTTEGIYQEQIFSSKDLILIKSPYTNTEFKTDK